MSVSFDDEYLTVREIAERLQLNQQTLRNWIDQGQLPAIRIGRRVRVRRVDLERILAEGVTIPDVTAEAPGAAEHAQAQLARAAEACEQLSGELESARRLLGKRSAARRNELAEGLQNLSDAVAAALAILSGEAERSAAENDDAVEH